MTSPNLPEYGDSDSRLPSRDGYGEPSIIEGSELSRRPAPVVWGALLTVVAVLAAFVESNPLHPVFQGIDDSWRQFIGRSPADPFWQGPFPMFFQYVCDTLGAILVCAGIAVLLLIARRWRHALYSCVALALGAGAVTQLLKNWLDRPRPAENAHLDLWGPLILADHGSFPSGHSAAAASLAVIVYVALPPTWVLMRKIWPFVGVAFVLCTMWERTLINAHWLSDTIAGACLGAGISLFVWWLLGPWMERDNERYSDSVVAAGPA